MKAAKFGVLLGAELRVTHTLVLDRYADPLLARSDAPPGWSAVSRWTGASPTGISPTRRARPCAAEPRPA
jgi:hypothetical protein